ncbi:flavin reductase family protein [Streptomyces rhizosphaericus]|uniref:flavin reductase family protein n=1 Tax=Streptomyces rhizosphaericus TaxID=114699 RepID=UPI00202E3B14|nr:flavin reductase family protein [Streptomyces rhizosphaericus]
MITVGDLREHPLDQVHRLMEPGPVILVTTQQRGIPNVMTNGFNMMIRHVPPLIGCTIGPWDYSYSALRETGECVISIPDRELAVAVVDIGNCSGHDVDKFKEFGLTPVAAQQVQAPLIAECFANIECRVVDTTLVGTYDLFVLEAVRAWTDPSHPRPRMLHHRGDGTFTCDGDAIDLKDRMHKWQYLL